MTWRRLDTLCTCLCHISLERELPQHSYNGCGFFISIITSGKSINIYIYIYINYHIFGLFLCECIKCKTHTPYKKADGISFPLMYNTYVCMQYPPCARPFYNTGYFGCHGNKNLAPNLLPWQRGSQNINRST